ncbi:MAG TPA: hypothetical protein EYG03_10790 [Planctomycetes bacterium]|nr:hypothetical protein [Fuerstiella sp.]HIK92454.1 hypothetical protein [Planctomycetota bacterium]
MIEVTNSDSVEQPSPEQEHCYHHYRGNVIPWYVRAIWIGFWIFAVYYIITYLFPAMRIELISPP